MCFILSLARVVALALRTLSECHLHLGDVETAKRLGEEVLAIVTSSEQRQLPDVGLCEYGLACCVLLCMLTFVNRHDTSCELLP